MGGLLTFPFIGRVLSEPVVITGVQVTLKAAVTPSLQLCLFDSVLSGSTTVTDNAAYSLAVADAFKLVAAIPVNALGGYLTDHGTPNSYTVNNLGIVCAPADDSQSLYGLLVDLTGVTLTSTSDVQVRLRGVGV